MTDQPSDLAAAPFWSNLADFNGEAPAADFFEMGMYSNPFIRSNVPMEMGSFTDTFGWVMNTVRSRGRAC